MVRCEGKVGECASVRIWSVGEGRCGCSPHRMVTICVVLAVTSTFTALIFASTCVIILTESFIFDSTFTLTFTLTYTPRCVTNLKVLFISDYANPYSLVNFVKAILNSMSVYAI